MPMASQAMHIPYTHLHPAAEVVRCAKSSDCAYACACLTCTGSRVSVVHFIATRPPEENFGLFLYIPLFYSKMENERYLQKL